MSENKTGRYFKYAIGEIILVVIGILIALGINNWNENRQDRILEQNYINELRTDLQKDFVAIQNLVNESNKQITSKYLLSKYLEDHTNLRFYNSTEIYPEFVKTKNYNTDSLFLYYRKVWTTTYTFTPITTTIDEMKSTGRIGIITDKKLRRAIIETYNNYELYLSKYEARYNSTQADNHKMIFDDIPELYLLDNSNIIELLHNPRVLNRFQANFVVTLNTGLLELQEVNQKLLNALNE